MSSGPSPTSNGHSSSAGRESVDPLRPRVRTDITVTELDGEAVIYDERSGDLHHLNAPATLVLGLCDGSATVEEMSVAIAEAFGQPVGEVTVQVSAFVEELRGSKVLADSHEGLA
jgi:PqqD family protein of HPr-rel-A system